MGEVINRPLYNLNDLGLCGAFHPTKLILATINQNKTNLLQLLPDGTEVECVATLSDPKTPPVNSNGKSHQITSVAFNSTGLILAAQIKLQDYGA